METNRIARLGSSLAWCKGVSKRHYLSHSALEALRDQFLNNGNGKQPGKERLSNDIRHPQAVLSQGAGVSESLAGDAPRSGDVITAVCLK